MVHQLLKALAVFPSVFEEKYIRKLGVQTYNYRENEVYSVYGDSSVDTINEHALLLVCTQYNMRAVLYFWDHWHVAILPYL